jgi:hypothetical protein
MGQAGSSQAIRQRVQLPGIFLLIVAGLNLLGALYLLFGALTATLHTPEELYEQQKQFGEAFPFFKEPMKEYLARTTPEEIKSQTMLFNWTFTGLSLLGSLLGLLAGIGMLRMRWFGLAVAGSIATAIPCVSCLGCCGVGEGIGIWSLVVLLAEEVRAAFH